MIGQTKILQRLDKLIQEKKFPHFCILIGPEGSGRRTIAHHIQEQFTDAVFSIRGTSVDDIRQMITDCNAISGTTNICLIPDADNMSVQAKNALLKITEEPPKDTYIIITLEDINNTLDTIKSRATTFTLEPYTVPQIEEYAKLNNYKPIDIITDICETPGEVDKLCAHDVSEFYSFVNKTVDSIATVNGANAFKIANKLRLKDTNEGYDLQLFLKMFIRICTERYMDDVTYITGIQITSQYLKDLRIKGISKQGLVDLWILDIRKAWM